MKKTIITGLLAALVAFSSCESWIDVKPSDRLSEGVLFSSREGFLKALNGIYLAMADNSLYGLNMSAGPIDVMGQYYNTNSSSHAYYYVSRYTYTNANPKALFDNVWQKTYELINNCNIILEKCGDSNPHLNDTYFRIVKGETLALRAMLHLDMFRLFGPIYSSTTQDTKCLPYMTLADQKVQPLSTAKDFCGYIMQDLTEALGLLESADPVRTEGTLNSTNPAGSNDLHYRQFRLNYFAVKTLIMRTQMVTGDNTNALATAKAIIAEAKTGEKDIFPFVTTADATNATAPDRVFSTEVIYAIYKSNRVKVFEERFAHTLNSNNILTFAGSLTSGRVPELYDDQNDFRYRAWASAFNENGVSTLYFRKFEDISGTSAVVSRSRHMMPLMRLSEIYLAVAELTNDLTEGTEHLNRVRASRNCFSLEPANLGALRDLATLEFRKEFIGEGQMFFYYKRRNTAAIPNGAAASGTVSMTVNNYVVPLPDSEISERVE